jgi:hypothetical protein
MSPVLGSLRRMALAPSLTDVTFATRGFPGRHSDRATELEKIPQAVVCGFEWGIETAVPWELERRLSMVEPELRGFAYEGATMAYTIRDSVSGHRTRDLLLGSGEPHIFLAYIGIGFAMARLPRPLWPKVLPDLTGSRYHPTMSWLAVDGYGFDRAYFDTERWVERQAVPRPYPWAGCASYFPRALDQGIGRALWFIHGADGPGAAAHIDRFAPERRPDLWSGLGLAATFAGGATGPELEDLRARAGAHEWQLALGAVFAAKARHHSGSVPPQARVAVEALTGTTLENALDIADRTEVVVDGAGPGTVEVDGRQVPPYELWRERIRRALSGRTVPVAG